MRLKQKTVLITGAAQGIGLSIASLFHWEGATVILSDIQDDEGQKQSATLGQGSMYMHLDVGMESDWQKVTHHIMQKFGSLDVLVNNAGITGFLERQGPFDPEHTDLDTWDYIHRVNATGVMMGCKYAIQMMKAKGGSIINISSRSGIVGVPAAAGYASSKASVRNHTKSVALYCAEKRYAIRCNSIHPAAIMTPMWNAMLGEGEERSQIIKFIEDEIPLGRFGHPDEVAYAALFLASEESAYITGSEIHVDGGILAGSTASAGKKS